MTKIKISLNRLNSRMEMTEESSTELYTDQQKFRTTYRKYRYKKSQQAQGSVRQQECIYHSYHHRKRGKRMKGWKYIWRNNSWIWPKLGQRHKSTDLRSWVKFKQNKPKKFMLSQSSSNFWKLKIKEKIMKAAREKQYIIYRGITIQIIVYFSWKTIETEGNDDIF